jgi:hypothetical protein
MLFFLNFNAFCVDKLSTKQKQKQYKQKQRKIKQTILNKTHKAIQKGKKTHTTE